MTTNKAFKRVVRARMARTGERYAAARRTLAHPHDALGMIVGQGLEQDAVDEAEDGGVAADPDGERGERDDGEAAALEQRATRELQVLEEFAQTGRGGSKQYRAGRGWLRNFS